MSCVLDLNLPSGHSFTFCGTIAVQRTNVLPHWHLCRQTITVCFTVRFRSVSILFFVFVFSQVDRFHFLLASFQFFIMLFFFAFSSPPFLFLHIALFASISSHPIDSPLPSYSNSHFAQHYTRHFYTRRGGAPTLTPLHSASRPSHISSLPSSSTTIVAHISTTASFSDDHTFSCHQITFFCKS